MKKILSILIAVALMMSLTVSAFAAETETPVVTVSSTTAEVGEEVTLDVSISATTLAGYGLKVVYDKEALEITKIAKGADAGEGFFSGSKKTGKVTYATTYNEDTEGVLFTVTFKVLAEGQHTVSLEIDSFGRDDQTTFEVTTVDGMITVGDVGGETPEVGEGSIEVTTTDTYGYFDLYSMTAPATGTYTFYVPAGLGVWSMESYIAWGDPEIDFYDNTEGYELVKDLTEGEVFEFYVGATTKDTWTITYTYTTSGEGGGDDPVDPPAVLPDIYDLVLGNNSINAADIGFKYTATEAGTLVLNLGNAIMGPVEGVVTVNGANEQTFLPMDRLELTLEANDEVLVIFTASGYATMTAEWTAGGTEEPVLPNISALQIGNNAINAADTGFKYTATEAGTLVLNMGNALMGPVEAVVTVNGTNEQALAAGTSIELALQANDEVLIIVTASGYATLIAEWKTEGGEQPPVDCEHEYVDGVCIHCGEEDPNYQPPTEEPDGTQGNPFIIETLPYEAVQETTDDLYYQWTAPEAGFLYVYHADGMVALSGSSVASWEYCEGGKYMEVAAGDVVTINYWSGTGFTVEFIPASQVEIEYIILDSVDNVTIDLAAGESGYYKWIATEDGEITFEITDYSWSGSYLFVAELNGEYFNVGKIVLNVTSGDEVIFYFEAPGYAGDGSLTFSGVYTVVECEHEFVDGVCTKCGEEDPNYVPECEHEFVDGVCTKCGEADPNYNPETGSMNIFAMALIAAMSVTAVVVTAKKRDEE